MNQYILRLDEYEIANLISALEAAVGFAHEDSDPYARLVSPLQVLNSGDWIGQILNKLHDLCPSSEVAPNRKPEEYAVEARRRAVETAQAIERLNATCITEFHGQRPNDIVK
jgi:hypothetical protein